MQSKNKLILLFIIFLAYLYFRGIGDHGLIDPVEGVNASVGLSMLNRGNYFIPRIGENLISGKSLGSWWLISLGLKFFGWSVFSVRFFSALSGLGMIFAAAFSAKRSHFESSRKAWLAASICAGTLSSFTASQFVSSHALYSCLTGLCMMSFIRGYENKNWFIFAHLFALLALISHGLEGIILPYLVFIIFAILNDDGESVRKFFLWPPAAFTLIFGAGLYFITLIFKNPYIFHFMRCETIRPNFGNSYGGIIFILISFMPWHGFIIQAVIDVWPSLENFSWSEFALTDKNNPRAFILLWAIVFASASILMQDYMSLASCVPAISALLGDMVDIWLYNKRFTELKIATALNIVILLPIILIGIPIILFIIPNSENLLLSLIPYALLIFLFLFACWYYTKTKQVEKWARNVPGAALLCLMPLAGVFDLMAVNFGIHDAGMNLREIVRHEDVVIQYEINYPSSYFYTLKNSILVNSDLSDGIQEKKLFRTPDQLTKLWTGNNKIFMLIKSNIPIPDKIPGNAYNIMDSENVSLWSNK